MPHAQAIRLAIVIPAHRPSGALLDIIARLAAESGSRIVLVDDASGPEFQAIFARAGSLPGVDVLRHPAFLGQGAAIKTGVQFALLHFPALTGMVIADAANRADDVAQAAEKLLAHPDALILTGPATLPGALTGRDSGAVLCGVPVAFAPRLLQIESNGPEYHVELLLAARHSGFPTALQPALAGAASFNPLLQSTRLPFVLARFAAASLLTSLLDNVVFLQAMHRGARLVAALALARLIALAFNYPVVRGAVFRSRRPHKETLPGYLLLAAALAVSVWAGIALLGAFGVATLPAKLLVETLFFLPNFALQRLFVFPPEPLSEPAPAPRRRAWPAIAAVLAVFLGGLALELHGFLTATLFSQDVWEPIGVRRFERYIGMFVALAFPLLMLVPWTFAGTIAGLAAVGTAFAVGPLPLLAVAFYLVSCCALGSRLLGREHGDTPEEQVFATLLGAALWIFVMTAIARLPVNYPAVWAALLALPVALDWRGAARRLARWWQMLRGAELRRIPERVSFALLIFVLLAHWFVALMPDTSADGLAMHLAIPMNIAAHHALTYQPDRVLWAVMPMGGDFSYSIVYLMGGEYAAHLLDYALLLLVVAVIYFAMRRSICSAAAFWILALFASTPLVQLVTGSLFIENMLAAMIAGMAAALWRFSDTGKRRYFYLAAALGGTAIATKFGALAFVGIAVPFLAMEAVRHRKSLGRRPAAACALAVLLLLALAAPPYYIAYAKTGNPLFPFLYDKIPSPLIPRDAGLVDERFKHPLTWNTPYVLTFHTNQTYEGQNGSFGFQYLVLAPLGIAALLVVKRKFEAASAIAIAVGAAAIVMGTQPNARYLYAALPLLSVPFAALLGWAACRPWLYRSLLLFAIVMTILNLRFMPSASYYHRDFCLRLPFSRAEHARYRDQAAPIRAVIDYFNRQHPHAGVLLTAESAVAGLNADFYENHWHQIHTLLQIRATKTVPDMVRLMEHWGIQYFISPKPEAGNDIQPDALKQMLIRCANPVFEQGTEYLARLDPECRAAPPRPPVYVTAGTYDDFDPSLTYRGDWNHDSHFDQPDRHTVSYGDASGSEVEIDFAGTALTYTYTRAANRGIASLTVDGVEKGPIDLYSAGTEWQSRTRLCCFAPGRHTAILRVTGKSAAQSKGRFVDLDSFTVE